MVFDQGFGDKTALFSDFTHIQNSFLEHRTDPAYQFTGFGDPTPVFIEVPFVADGITDFPDEGGVRVILEGKFDPAENYFFQIVGKDETIYPSATTYASAAKAGKEGLVKPFRNNERVSFALPPMPPGLYDIEVYYGENKSLQLTLSEYIRVIRKNRSSLVYSVRAKYPEVFRVGARNYIVDRVDLGGAE